MSNEIHSGKNGGRINRRAFVGGSAAALGSAFVAPLLSPSAHAATERPPMGTYPAGVKGDSVFLGLVSPLTGPFSATGMDLKNGYELALAHLNDGAGIGQLMDTLKGTKGVLGKRLKWAIGDTETKPNVAIQLATKFIRENHAIMISGGTASSTAVALSKLAQREKVINMTGASGANETTGTDCQRFTFRSQLSAYMAGKALAPVLEKELGRNLKVAYLVPDYNYGHSVENSTKKFTAEIGWKPVITKVAPVGTADFSSYLIDIANSGADVFVNVEFGDDSVVSSKQAKQFGILDKMKMVVPNISPFQTKAAGTDVMQGAYGTIPFYWGMEDRNPYAKMFVETFFKKFNYKPRWCAHIGYMQLFLWADAVTRAKSFYPADVIAEFEKQTHVQTTLGDVYYRACDHQLVRDVPVVVGKKESEKTGPEDNYKIVGIVPGKDAVPPCEETGCKMPSI